LQFEKALVSYSEKMRLFLWQISATIAGRVYKKKGAFHFSSLAFLKPEKS